MCCPSDAERDAGLRDSLGGPCKHLDQRWEGRGGDPTGSHSQGKEEFVCIDGQLW